MFVYIFCIIWATIFAYLAERQFKRVPIATKTDNKRRGIFNRLAKDNRSAKSAVVRGAANMEGVDQGGVIREALDQNDLNQEGVIQGSVSHGDSNQEGRYVGGQPSTDDQELLENTLGSEVANLRSGECVTRDKGRGMIISDFIYPYDYYAEKMRKNIVERNLPLNAGPASQDYRLQKELANKHNHDGKEIPDQSGANKIQIAVYDNKTHRRINKKKDNKEQRGSETDERTRKEEIKGRRTVGMEISRRKGTGKFSSTTGKRQQKKRSTHVGQNGQKKDGNISNEVKQGAGRNDEK